MQEKTFAVTVPLLEDDGRRLRTRISAFIARTAYQEGGDEQNYISLSPDATLEKGGASIQNGWLRPVRIRTQSDTNTVFVYPRDADDPPAEVVRQSFKPAKDGFTSVLGRVTGNLYVGRTAAGGEGTGIDLDGDGEANDRTSSLSARGAEAIGRGRLYPQVIPSAGLRGGPAVSVPGSCSGSYRPA